MHARELLLRTGHIAVVPGMGKIAVLLALESAASADKLEEVGKQIAMHIAAAKPDALSIDKVDPSKLTRESEILKEQARATGKLVAMKNVSVRGKSQNILIKNFYVSGSAKTVIHITIQSFHLRQLNSLLNLHAATAKFKI
jgi:translation elongation factor EF-Ts